MSIEIHVILPSGFSAPTRDEWESAIISLQLAIVFYPDFSPDHARGFCPMMIAGQEGGCEVDFNLETVEALWKGKPDLSDLPADANVFSFRFGRNLREAACAYAAAAGLMGRYGTVLYDTMEGTLSRDADAVAVTSKQLLAVADVKNGMVPPSATKGP